MNYQPTIQELDAFNIDIYGLAIIIKLVEKRIETDLSIVREKITLEQQKKIIPKTNGRVANVLKGSYDNLKHTYDNWRAEALRKELTDKKQWLTLWSEQAWVALSHNPGLRNLTIEELKTRFLLKKENEYKMYLLLQEAILTPVYAELEGFPKGLSERDMNKGIAVITTQCGFPGEVGKNIIKNTGNFLKEVNNYWGRVIKWSIAGTGAAILTAGLAAPAIAAAIGGTMGLAGAAATSAGLAAIGGGAIAAGGLGMAGGMQILIGGGALLGAVGGGSIANFIGKLPKDAIAVSMVKIINYITYLRTYYSKNDFYANHISQSVIKSFLMFKHEAETEFLLKADILADTESTRKALDIMTITLKKLGDV
ncbi:hypothetical protein [Alkalihalobacterium elongatum]|uniref:hypothetical protein n=1 Tax=Alkalihalobacterium elongatum TaxID=2675466 RepID=UPI001C20089E|nr:hypothetical protein [Alkalihalobacterium elongatum]